MFNFSVFYGKNRIGIYNTTHSGMWLYLYHEKIPNHVRFLLSTINYLNNYPRENINDIKELFDV